MSNDHSDCCQVNELSADLADKERRCTSQSNEILTLSDQVHRLTSCFCYSVGSGAPIDELDIFLEDLEKTRTVAGEVTGERTPGQRTTYTSLVLITNRFTSLPSK